MTAVASARLPLGTPGTGSCTVAGVGNALPVAITDTLLSGRCGELTHVEELAGCAGHTHLVADIHRNRARRAKDEESLRRRQVGIGVGVFLLDEEAPQPAGALRLVVADHDRLDGEGAGGGRRAAALNGADRRHHDRGIVIGNGHRGAGRCPQQIAGAAGQGHRQGLCTLGIEVVHRRNYRIDERHAGGDLGGATKDGSVVGGTGGAAEAVIHGESGGGAAGAADAKAADVAATFGGVSVRRLDADYAARDGECLVRGAGGVQRLAGDRRAGEAGNARQIEVVPHPVGSRIGIGAIRDPRGPTWSEGGSIVGHAEGSSGVGQVTGTTIVHRHRVDDRIPGCDIEGAIVVRIQVVVEGAGEVPSRAAT